MTASGPDGRFPRAARYDADWVRRDAFGAHPLWLAEWLAEEMHLAPGMAVLDLGCGRAKSSIFLAREFGVRVWATDLWITATENREQVHAAGLESAVFPIHADARTLPYAEEFFDAVVAIDSFQYYGTDDLYLNYLTQFVRPGGRIGFASAGLMRDFEAGVPDHLERFWGQDCWCLHSADWWRRHWERTALVAVERADVMSDGWRTWLDWARANGCPRWYLETLERDAGRHLGYVRVVATRREGVERWVPPTPRGDGPT
jgi:cyclopropane fatty-acyl-phospholipid synthase-like methyltransferase